MKLRAFPDKPASFRIHRWVNRNNVQFFSVTFKQDIFPIEEDADLIEILNLVQRVPIC